VLPLVAKLFEKILSTQISYYFESSNLFFAGQHGFRRNHSCETASHELTNDCFGYMSKNMISILLFIDFKKAFDLVNQDLLLYKLGNYGFNASAISLLRNYFKNRCFRVKIGDHFSQSKELSLGVPQGSVLGPLLFLIFINDLPNSISSLAVKMFADDTTIYLAGNNLNDLIDSFKNKINDFIVWCKFNKMDINWSKTKCMFISRNSKISLPKQINIGSVQVEVVNKFRLLGIELDSNLNFSNFLASIYKCTNRRLFAIKRLFFISHKVKTQFFKTFLLPYFDYCTSLVVYFKKCLLLKFYKCYYACLFKLFKYNFVNKSVNEINTFLSKYGLQTIQYRLISKFIIFMYKIKSLRYSPKILKDLTNVQLKSFSYKLRNPCQVDELKTKNKYGEMQFKNIYIKTLNIIGLNTMNMDAIEFKNYLIKNINFIYLKFIEKFNNFNILDYQVYFYY
jgi:hypothetical protein